MNDPVDDNMFDREENMLLVSRGKVQVVAKAKEILVES